MARGRWRTGNDECFDCGRGPGRGQTDVELRRFDYCPTDHYHLCAVCAPDRGFGWEEGKAVRAKKVVLAVPVRTVEVGG